jgi:hypothetical protein
MMKSGDFSSVQANGIVLEGSNSHYGKSGRIMGKMKSETIKHEREKMLPAIKINVTS